MADRERNGYDDGQHDFDEWAADPWAAADDAERERREQARRRVRRRLAAAGAALMAAAVAGTAGNLSFHAVSTALAERKPPPQPPPNMGPEERKAWERGRASGPGAQLVCLGGLSLAVYLPVFLGGQRLREGRVGGLATTAAVLALLPCSPGFLFGLPMGIWALAVLSSQEVKDYVRTRRRDRDRR